MINYSFTQGFVLVNEFFFEYKVKKYVKKSNTRNFRTITKRN